MPPTSTTAWEQYINRDILRIPVLGNSVNKAWERRFIAD